MLEKSVKIVLNTLDNWIGTAYQVVTKQEIAVEVAKQLKCSTSELDSILNFLSEKKYIDVRFDDGVEICLATTSKAKSYLQHSDSQVTKTKLAKSNFIMMFLLITLASFVGSLLANLII